MAKHWFQKNTARFQHFRQSLTSLDSHPVGPPALIVVLLLDLFILISIFEGLADQTRQLARPDQVVPTLCRDMVINRTWTTDNHISRLAAQVTQQRSASVRQWDNPEPVHALCKPLTNLVRDIQADNNLYQLIFRFQDLRQQLNRSGNKLSISNDAEQTRLLEKSDDQQDDDLTVISAANRDSREELNQQLAELQQLEQDITANPAVSALHQKLGTLDTSAQETLASTLQSINFWFPVKRLGLEMLFLTPLVLAFYFWYSRSNKARRSFQTLISAHLLVVVCVPVVLKFTELLYDIIPRQLLEKLLALLAEFHLIALWHYLMMAVVIALAVGVVYLLQQKLFSQQRLILRRISRNQCQACGVKLPSGAEACPECGFNQMCDCEHCNVPTLKLAPHCMHCGQQRTQS